MKITLLIFSVLAIVVLACNKDKFQTKPTISIKSISGDYIPFNTNFEMTLECTDKEGDVQDTFFIFKRRLNKRVVPTTARDTMKIPFPVFPGTQRIELVATIVYQDILAAITPLTIPGSNPPQKELDTLILRIAVKDKAGNVSDTIETKQLQVFRQ